MIPQTFLSGIKTALRCCRADCQRSENARRAAGYRRFVTEFTTAPLEEIQQKLRTGWNALVGEPAEVVDQINAFAAAGVDELMLHWVDTAEMEGLDLLAEQVLPHVK